MRTYRSMSLALASRTSGLHPLALALPSRGMRRMLLAAPDLPIASRDRNDADDDDEEPENAEQHDVEHHGL
jgi:hypothetical protein